jgi:hypothetical protein
MGTVLGLIGIALFIAGVIALAYGVTWSVVRVWTPGKKPAEPKSEST